MFGEHGLRTRFIKIGDKRIHLLEEKGDIVRYRRDDTELLIKKSDNKLGIFPAPAVGYGVKFLMIKFKAPVVVPPRDSLTGFVEAPIEVDVRLGGKSVDHFIVGREKYALYGTIEAGLIARYHLSPFYLEEPDSLGVVGLILTNPSDDWKSLDRIVFPITNSTMYYSGDRGYYPLLIVTMKNHIPEVNNTGKPPREGLNAVGDAGSLPNFLMRW
ncbi:DUF432 domain-containing protein [Thermococcus celer]|uniref:DUF432 domain-containing protein n=1 Tax=Thermococcus celer Vu 13 = JCM 8558 TaxID=1293037 RepID=A0A218P4U0_THECE|nr:DUF432 domain-containing protein [Thermococcus celer]ASI99941.1 hypothetical protein A3L02_06595 [Thermococcus celer Vu 13 = JCM 8558]